ncbi:hypothetical protein OPV22_032439 [Ensete ventricosum]|uniref:Reverse transcriptase Ty1/copia-type domain-containing protein n=1 Tax=Ensete ventricosum TaxID=4639 RepID=A0AAV8PY94_ENSVE|nr:hypothetical protein OPV22_032439 [Ensete ventricosum]
MTEWCTFVGYPKETCGYYFYHPEDRKVFVAKRAVFLEKEHILGGNNGSEIELSEVGEPSSNTIPESESVQVPNTQIPNLYRSSRVSHPSERYVGHISGDDSRDIDPQTYEEAIMSIDSGKWHEAMNSEMDSMYSNKQMDVKTAFLNGNLEEEVYMIQPEGFVSKESPDKVCKLLRSIYGLKQASRSWNTRFDEVIRSYDFVKNEDEPCVYRKVSGSAITFLVLYVDDILIIGNDVGMLSTVKAWLSRNFSMKDLGEASYILGIRIYRDRSKRMFGLSQSRYIDSIVKRFGMENSKRGLTPMRHRISLSMSMSPKTPEERTDMDKIPYASVIGSIMYAMLYTRPDIAHALSVTSKYQADPGAVSSKQDITADSTIEAECIAAAEAEGVWMKKFIEDLGVVPSSIEPIPIHCDNNEAVAQANEPRSHQKSKHILRRFHLIREIIARKDIAMERVPSEDNIVNPLTKPLA